MPPLPESEADADVAVTEQTDANKVVVESRIKTASIFSAIDEWPFQLRAEELCTLQTSGPVRRHGRGGKHAPRMHLACISHAVHISLTFIISHPPHIHHLTSTSP